MKQCIVLLFGSFDPLHKGHRYVLRQAKRLGTKLVVVVARDSTIRSEKKREPYQGERRRLAAVSRISVVDEAVLGDDHPQDYGLLSTLDFDVVALGYDQLPSNTRVRNELDKRGKQYVKVVRLKPYKPQIFKSTHLRKAS